MSIAIGEENGQRDLEPPRMINYGLCFVRLDKQQQQRGIEIEIEIANSSPSVATLVLWALKLNTP